MAFLQVGRVVTVAIIVGLLVAVCVWKYEPATTAKADESATTAKADNQTEKTANERLAALEKELKEVEDRANIQEKVHSFYSNSITNIGLTFALVLFLPGFLITMWLLMLEKRQTKNFEDGEKRLKGEMGEIVEAQINEAVEGFRKEVFEAMISEGGRLETYFNEKQGDLEKYLLSTVLQVHAQAKLRANDDLGSLLSFMEACSILLGSQHPHKIGQFVSAGIGIENACRALSQHEDKGDWNTGLVNEVRELRQKILMEAAGNPGEQVVRIQHERTMKWLDSEYERLENLEADGASDADDGTDPQNP